MIQLDLFARRRPKYEEEVLLKRLREAALDRRPIPGVPYSRAAIKRLMRPLPPITVPR